MGWFARFATVTAFAFSGAAASQSAAQSSAPDTYLLKPGDVVSISVIEDPGLNKSALVRPDGRVSLPLGGSVLVQGRSPEEVASIVRSRLSREFVVPPTVSVSLDRLGEEIPTLATVYAMGAIAQPGAFQVQLPMDLLQFLALAGGPSPFAATDRIQVRRRSPQGDMVFFFDYDVAENGQVPVTEIVLLEGDVVLVPERGLFE